VGVNLPTNAEFWWNWGVQALSAVATVAAVYVALFGGWIRHKLTPPKLRISLLSTEGKETDALMLNPNEPSGPPVPTPSRWYHVRVTNDRKWAEATEVQVWLVRIEELDAAGQFRATWAEEVPLKWRYMTVVNPAATRVVGHDQHADLIAFYKRGVTTLHPFLQLQALLIPSRLNIHRTGDCRLRLVLAARGREAVSNELTVDVGWNGRWPESAEDAVRGIVIREVGAPSRH
jgi:hypothetical protein